jgi:GAF domain-containing protein
MLKRLFSPPVFPGDPDKTRDARLVHQISATSLALPVLAITFYLINPTQPFALTASVIFMVTLVVLLFLNRAGHVRLAGALIVSILAGLFTSFNFINAGQIRSILLVTVTVILMSGLVLGPRAPIIVAIFLAVQHLIIAMLGANGVIVAQSQPTFIPSTIVVAVAYLLIAILYRFAISKSQDALAQARESENKLQASNRELQAISASLEQRINQRTSELEKQQYEAQRRSRQFEAITRISKAISTTRNLQDTLPEITRLISEQFGFYHVGIFLSDSAGEYAILSAANSEGGRRMLNRGHQLKIGEQGIVGYAISTARARVALSVGDDVVYFNNPDLPATQSEMALPLTASGDQVIGALDIQSTMLNAFSPDDVEVLTSLADQVSLAIQNARLFDQTAKLLSESEAIQRQYLRETWSRLPSEQGLTGYKYSIAGAAPLGGDHEESHSKDPAKREVSVPISLRGENIGVLVVQVPHDEKIGPDQLDLIKAVAERVALSAENARLFDETQKRAAQLESLNEMGRMVSQQIELKAVLLAAYEQLRRVIPLDAYLIALYDETKQTVKFPLVVDEGHEFVDSEDNPLNPDSSTGKVLLTGKPILQLLTEAEHRANVQKGMMGNTSKISASLMYLPLVVAQKTIGVLSIQSYALNAYTQEQVILVENIANQLSIAIQNARLFEEANRRAERERIISEITSKIGSSVRTESILKTTARELNQLLDGAEVLIRLGTNGQEKENL